MRRKKLIGGGIAALLLSLLLPLAAAAQDDSITLASGTSPSDSGLLQHILPQFEEDAGIRVEVIAVSSSEALAMSQGGDVDAVLAHHTAAERDFMAHDMGLLRAPVALTHFLIAGPPDDPAGIREADSAIDAMRQIFEADQRFISRGDDSGIHARELMLWEAAGVSAEDRAGDWHVETHTGMADTLNGAGAMGAYTLVDYPTWLRFGRGGGLASVYEDPHDPDMLDVYRLLIVNPDHVDGVNVAGARALLDWLSSGHGREMLANFRVSGERAYQPFGN